MQSDDARPPFDVGRIGLPDGRSLLWRGTGPIDAPVLLWLHGSTGSARTAPRSEAVRVLSYDRPGYGDSTLHPSRNLLSDATDAEALLDQLGIGHTHILAFSGGAAVGLAAAVRLGSRVRHLGVASGAVWPSHPAPTLAAVERAADELHANPAAAIDRLGLDAPKRDEDVLNTPTLREELLNGALDAFAAGTQGWVQEAMLLRTEWPIKQGSVHVPVTWWHGESDPIVPIGAADATVAALPQARLHRLPDAGHLGWMLQRDHILNALMKTQ